MIIVMTLFTAKLFQAKKAHSEQSFVYKRVRLVVYCASESKAAGANLSTLKWKGLFTNFVWGYGENIGVVAAKAQDKNIPWLIPTGNGPAYFRKCFPA